MTSLVADPDNLKPSCCAIVNELLQWEVAEEDIEVSPVSGGITNLLYLVEHKERKVLLRIFGKNTELLIDRPAEIERYKFLSDKGIAPPFLGGFKNGRLEGFLTCRPLKPQEMRETSNPNFVKSIASQLAEFHQLESDEKGGAILWKTIGKWKAIAEDIINTPEGAKDLAALVSKVDFSKLNVWIKRYQQRVPSPATLDGAALLEKLKGERKEEGGSGASAAEDDPVTAARKFGYELCFCHNDLLSGNILVVEGREQVQLVDFEYGGYNYRGFDIGNHFCEYAGFDFEFEKLYPGPEARETFLRYYMDAMAPPWFNTKPKEWQQAFCAEFSAVVNELAVAAHLFWGFWAVVQAKYSPIDFDFADYARMRFEGFFFHCSSVFPDIDDAFPSPPSSSTTQQ